jgi:DNA-binding NarL/FixJ family response regulator
MRCPPLSRRRRGSTSDLRELRTRLRAAEDARRIAEVALSATLDALAGDAFVVAPDGCVSALDAAARAALDADSGALARDLARAATGDGGDSVLVRAVGVDGSGGHVVLRVNPRRAFAMRLERAARVWQLTARHTDVAALLVRGLCNKEIAARLDCAVHTIELHVTEMLRRSRLATRAALIAAFWSEG